jgi:hypothetical protein
MKKQGKLMNLIEKGVQFADKHQREIMLGGAIAGSVVTAVLSWKAGIKADEILKEQKEKIAGNEEDMTKEGADEAQIADMKREVTIETAKKLAPVVAPPALALTSTIIAIVCGYNAASAQIATLSALYNMSEKALSEQLEKTKELIGPKKAQQITDEIAADHVKNNPPEKQEVIINTGRGTTLCYDKSSGRYFYSSPEDIRKSCNTINKRMMDEYFISLNELYDELGLPDIGLGEDIGFNIETGLIDIDHLFSATLHKDDTPILVLDYEDKISTAYAEHRGRFLR